MKQCELFSDINDDTPITSDLPGYLRQSLSPSKSLPIGERVKLLNELKKVIHEAGPFADEPVDCVLWVDSDAVSANDYNPNSVAPPEMELLRVSIESDGYTQPIVTWDTGYGREVVDGFHRNRVGKECKTVRERVHGFLPVVAINAGRQDKTDRIASTIRHNRARGKHAVTAMSDIVIELKRRNWSDEKVARELGMDQDEILRLCQITGLADAFADSDFSQAWEVGDESGIAIDLSGEQSESPTGRILHTWDKWECYRHGFYAERCPGGVSQEDGEEEYRRFLSDLTAFESSLQVVTSEWRYSCEHYLTNDRMNRIAWLGQASVAHAKSIPACCRGGYSRLTKDQQEAANNLALCYLNKWLIANGRAEVTMEEAGGRTEAELY